MKRHLSQIGTRLRRRSLATCSVYLVLVAFYGFTQHAQAEYPSASLRKSCVQTARQTRAALGNKFNLIVKAPYVIAGDLPQNKLQDWCDDTVYAASEALWHMFFTQRPQKPIRILLLSGDASYRKTARQLYGDTKVSHFGYYRSQDRTMIMNIGTGGGTLVHELTHALMGRDFPDAPVWFSEAMGSLFEKCTIREKRIKGLVNWRFPKLVKAHRKDSVIPLEKLFQKSRSDYNGRNSGLIYAEVRYLALYLQRKELLQSFYAEFRANHDADPTGKQTLQKATGQSLEKLQKTWLKWVKRLAQRRNTMEKQPKE